MTYKTIQLRKHDSVCFIRFYRPEANNAINNRLIEECHNALDSMEESISIVVLEGLPDFFCFGADFQDIYTHIKSGTFSGQNPERLYELWLKLTKGPFITISLVRGKANAGGIGFVAASDIVVADYTAQFSLSELIFGLYPACVMPFLMRRIGFQKANFLTLSTQPITVEQAFAWGLVDIFDQDGESLLRKQLIRLQRLSKDAIAGYKRYTNEIYDFLVQAKQPAIEANKAMFSETKNQNAIFKFIDKGMLPWEKN